MVMIHIYIVVNGIDETLAASSTSTTVVHVDHCGMIVGEAFFEDEKDSATQSVRGECSRAEQQNSYVPKQCPPEVRQHLSIHSRAHSYI